MKFILSILRDVASWDFIGGFRPYHGDENAMFDNKYDNRNMYHSSTCSEERGVTFTFAKKIHFVDLEVFTRTNCCRDRYEDVCVYANDTRIACTPSNLGDPGQKIHFKDYALVDLSTIEATTDFRNLLKSLLQITF